MNAKLELVKNIIINLFVILQACINLIYAYFILFLNERELSSSTTGIFAMPITISLYFISFLAYSLPLLPNLINLNPL